MIGLFNAPAVMRLPDSASTPVISPIIVGHKLDFASRVTCLDARAVKRATDIWGLFFTARSSASFKLRAMTRPLLIASAGTLIGGAGAACGDGAGGNCWPVWASIDVCDKDICANPNVYSTNTVRSNLSGEICGLTSPLADIDFTSTLFVLLCKDVYLISLAPPLHLHLNPSCAAHKPADRPLER